MQVSNIAELRKVKRGERKKSEKIIYKNNSRYIYVPNSH